MKLSLEQFRELLVDYLYGSLEGADLRSFEECLAESEVCRRELAIMQGTLRTAREGLATASEQPPAHVRSAVLAAAASAAQERKAERKSLRASSRPPVPLKPARVSVDAEPQGLWSWLRAPWLLPTLGVAAAVTLVVLNTDVVSPDMHRDDKPTASSEPSREPSSAPSSEPAPAAPSIAPVVQEPAEEAREAEGHGVALERESKAKPSSPSSTQHAEARNEPPRAAAPAKGYAAPPAYWEALRGESAKKAEKSATRPADKAAAEQVDDLAAAPRQEEPASSGGGGAPARAGARRAPSAADQGEALGGGVGSAPMAPAPAAESAASATRGRTTDATNADGAGESRDALVKRAREQMDARAWAPAAASYRELLRRFPADTQVSLWRKQLALANASLAPAP